MEIADEAVQWARDRDMDVREHVCLWDNVDAHAIPPRIVGARASGWKETNEANPDPDYVVFESMSHIERIISHYGTDITGWRSSMRYSTNRRDGPVLSRGHDRRSHRYGLLIGRNLPEPVVTPPVVTSRLRELNLNYKYSMIKFY